MSHALELISSAIEMEPATDPSKAWGGLRISWEVSEECLGGV